MKVKTSQETVRKLAEHLEQYDATTEEFLDAMPTPEKYAILAMALVVRGDYEDYEWAHDESMQKVSAQDLTRHIMEFPFLYCHLQDALRLKWEYFEAIQSNGEYEDEDEEP